MDRSVMVWDVLSGHSLRRWTGHQARVNALDYNPDSSVLVSGSYDSTLKLWDVRSQTRTPIQTLTDARDSVESVHVAGHEILSGSVDGCLRIHDVRMGCLTTDKIGQPVTHCLFSSDENCVLASSLDSKIRLFDKENGQLLADYRGHENKELRIRACLTPHDAQVIGGSEDGKIYIWDLVEVRFTYLTL